MEHATDTADASKMLEETNKTSGQDDIIVEELEGDLFDAPANAVLIHACNCLGSWGAGIAKTFKEKYPAAYNVHKDYCKATSNEALIGTCQLIPPQREDYDRTSVISKPPSKRRRIDTSDEESKEAPNPPSPRKHWIACLFTSVGYGKPTKKHPGMDKPEVILENTRKALIDFSGQLLKLESKNKKSDEEIDPKADSEQEVLLPGELWSCKFNRGLFAVNWADTRKILEEELKSVGKHVRVVSPATS